MCVSTHAAILPIPVALYLNLAAITLSHGLERYLHNSLIDGLWNRATYRMTFILATA
jgi:hypothetical protein